VDQPVAETVARAVDLIIAAQRPTPRRPRWWWSRPFWSCAIRSRHGRRHRWLTLAPPRPAPTAFSAVLCAGLGRGDGSYGPLLTLLLPLRVAELAGQRQCRGWRPHVHRRGFGEPDQYRLGLGERPHGHRRAWVAVGLVLVLRAAARPAARGICYPA
jgi:hypothetical protein